MDIQAIQRMMQLFPVMAQPGLDTYDQPPDNTAPATTNSSLLDQYQPRTDISSQLTDTLANVPQRPIPGRLRSIAASIAGMGAGASPSGIVGGQPIGFHYNPIMADAASDKVNYPDFDNQMSDWQNKVKALSVGASEEDRANAGEIRRLAGNAKNEIDSQKVQVAQQRADAYTKNAETKAVEESNKHASAQEKRKVEIARIQAQLKIAADRIAAGDRSQKARDAWHQAQIENVQALHEYQKADLEFKQEELKRSTDAKIESMGIMNDVHREILSGKTADTTLYDPKGNVTGRKVVNTGPTGANIITDPKTGQKYDTSTWTAADKAAAAAQGWK